VRTRRTRRSSVDETGFPANAKGLIEDALREARAARDRAYAPYSGFSVGAAVVSGGRIFTGENIENASYPVSVCAERNAVASMIDAGERRIDLVAVVTAAAEPTPPCGACRQVLWEFGSEALVVSETTGGRRAMWALADLLPDAFGPDDLDR
jgi:cytidine deaminase